MKRWLIVLVIARLFNLSCSVTSSLKDDSIYLFKILLLVSSILRKSSWEKIRYDGGFFVRDGCNSVCGC